MRQLHLQSKLPLGIAWSWVKASFAIFREKPINFTFFALLYIVFSLVPVIGVVLATLILVRIYISADWVVKQQNFDLSLGLGEIFRRRNIINYAIFNLTFDLIAMLVLPAMLNYWGVEVVVTATSLNARLIYLLLTLNVFRALFFGISLVLITFDARLTVSAALWLSWRFLARNCLVIGFSLFLLLPLLLVPLYLTILISFLAPNLLLLSLVGILLVLLTLLFISVTNIFLYKLFQDGMVTRT